MIEMTLTVAILRSRFERPAMPTPTPMPTPAPAGLTATPQAQEPNEEGSMFDLNMDSISQSISR